MTYIDEQELNIKKIEKDLFFNLSLLKDKEYMEVINNEEKKELYDRINKLKELYSSSVIDLKK